MTNEHKKPGATRGRSTLALEQTIDAAREGRTVWFISHDDASSRAHLAHCVELLQRRRERAYRVNSPRREIGLVGGTIRFVSLHSANGERGFVRPSLAPQFNRDPRFARLNPRETETGRIVFDHHAAYLLDLAERRRAREDAAAALIMGDNQS